ncbi:tRNA(Met) cytidine acetate ligase [Ruminococcus flavefaciens]|uniref:tRNA(Met) cytidine acetate ligase n=1 Tax=Ruminococcus flavefaciens TaxID=1265 RepID=A0A315XYF8_RUMFL|nr:nucleotidyltransferase family protein [Ruminococcus flavefaciens]PWJ10741.1 putative nucleotidyltransferase [Ruminococcus flavefaciens]SSA51317.1 Predicted nucleotidyltransferase [Ruminococcus flavefaciens]
MKVSGIICEYNPFHNGHLYHIRKTRENGATHIAAVMSGNFVQRGDTAVMDKLERARLAVRSGADLVIELPVQYSLASAENFASGAVHLLDSLGAVDELSFGSECGDTQKLLKAMETVDLAALTHADEIKSIMEKGYTYPRALNSVVNGYDPEAAAVIAEPNNTLAVEYLRALKRSGSAMEPFTVMREKAAHDGTEASDGFASASMLREMIENGESIDSFTTEEWAAAVRNAVKNGETASMSRLERVILYKLRTCSVEEIAQICDVGQGLEHRIYGARMAGSLDELLFTVKTKRYTMARIRRIMLALLIGITKTDMEQLPPYGRILAFNERGREILARAKGSAVIPFGSSIAKLSQLGDTAERFAELEIRASDIYGLALDTVTSAQKDYRAKIMIDME